MSPDESSEPPILQPSPSDAMTAPDPAADWAVPLPSSPAALPSPSLYPPMAGGPPPPPKDAIHPADTTHTDPQRNLRLVLLGMGSMGVLFALAILLLLQHIGIQNWFFQTNNTGGTTTFIASPPPRGLTSIPLVTGTPGVMATVPSNPSRTPTASPGTATPTSTPLSPSATPVTPTPVPTLTVSITCLTLVHNKVTLCVQTAAGAGLTIATVDCDGQLDPAAPTTGTADNTGMYSATWKPRRPTGGCHTATVTVTSTLNQQQSQTQSTLTI